MCAVISHLETKRLVIIMVIVIVRIMIVNGCTASCITVQRAGDDHSFIHPCAHNHDTLCT